MSCECGTTVINNWYDLQNTMPRNVFDLIAEARLNGAPGVFTYSDTYRNPGGTWVATPVTLASAPVCSALGSDNQQKVADAAQWDVQHLTANLNTDLAPPLRKMLYLRGGTQWRMTFQLNFPVQMDDVQLSFRDNAGTRGDYAGAVPVIDFSAAGPFSGTVALDVVLKQFGHACMGLRTISNAGDYSMYESEWIIVP